MKKTQQRKHNATNQTTARPHKSSFAARVVERIVEAATIRGMSNGANPWKPLLYSLGVNVLLFVAVYVAYAPQFNTRDDTIMMLLASGRIIALAPTEYLLHINVVLGSLLKALYSSVPSGYWYAWMLIAALFAAHTALLGVMLRKRPSLLTVALFVLYFVCTGAYMLVSLQYTMVALLLGFAGCAMLWFDSRFDSPARGWLSGWFSVRGVVGVLLLVFAWMLRWKSCALALACCALPVLLEAAWNLASVQRRGEWFSSVWRRTPALLLAAVLCAGAHGYNALQYSRWGDGEMLEFNALRETLQDERPFQRALASHEDVRAVLNKAGWSEYDLEMFSNEFYMNDTLFNTRNFRLLLGELSAREATARTSSNPETQGLVSSLEEKFSKQFWSRQRALVAAPDAVTALIGCCVVAALLMSLEQMAWMQLAAFVLGIGALTAFTNSLTLMRDLPERVLYPLCALLWFVPVIRSRSVPSSVTASIDASIDTSISAAIDVKRFVGIRLMLVVLGMVMLGVQLPRVLGRLAAIDRSVHEGKAELRRVVQTLNPAPHRLYVIWGDGFPMDGIAPFDGVEFADRFRALWLSWAERTPTSRAMLASYGVRDIYWDIATKDNVFVLLNANQVRSPTLMYQVRYEIYLNQHYKASVKGQNDGFRSLMGRGLQPQNPYKTYLEAKFRLQKRTVDSLSFR